MKDIKDIEEGVDVWVTKHLMSKGVYHTKVTLKPESHGYCNITEWERLRPGEWHRSPYAAWRQALKMIDKERVALDKKVRKLDKLQEEAQGWIRMIEQSHYTDQPNE